MTSEPVISVTGPVAKVGDQLVLRIPMETGGEALANAARGISSVVDGFLQINLPDWLAAKLGIAEDNLVDVDNFGGRLNVTRHVEQED
jgi:hypothetical protein